MKTDEFYWNSIDDKKIYGKYWAPEKEIRGVVCLVHGMGEHSGRFEPFGKFLTESGIALIGFDQRGHGKTEGKKGHTPSYEHLLQTVDDLIAKAHEFFPEVPLVLYGHSMGGNVVLNYVLDRKPQISGVIASSPWLRLAFDPPAIKVKMGEWMNKIYPAFTQSSKLDVSAISRIPEEVKKYENDPLVHDKISSMYFISIRTQGLYALEHADEFELPLLIFHGTGDQLTSWQATQEFAQKVKGDVTFKLFEGAYHEIHNDLPREELFNWIRSWLSDHF